MYHSPRVCDGMALHYNNIVGENHARVPFLHYSEGMHLTAYVTSVSSPTTFVAQPYGSQLVNLMHELR